MKTEITYPPVKKKKYLYRRLAEILKWPVLFAAYICLILNLVIGGKAWSLVVAMALYTFWTVALSPSLVEYNRISQFIKLITCACILLALIDLCLAPGWAIEVVPIVCFCGLAISGVLFFTDLERQKQNMLPMLLLIFLSLIGSVIGLCLWHEESRWALGVMGAFALALLLACAVVLGRDFIREFKRRFHTK